MPSKNRSLAKNFVLPELFCILLFIREHFPLQLFLQTGQARENGKTTSKSVWLTVTPRYAPSMRCFLPLPEWEISQRWYLTETSPPPSPSLLPVTS
jgi:hypothetical protein